jgi:hypothetical protein
MKVEGREPIAREKSGLARILFRRTLTAADGSSSARRATEADAYLRMAAQRSAPPVGGRNRARALPEKECRDACTVCPSGRRFYWRSCAADARRSSPSPAPSDEAKQAGVAPEKFVAADDDYFRDMDYNLRRPAAPAVHEEEIRPQHVDGVDRRRRSLLGHADRPRASDRSIC